MEPSGFEQTCVQVSGSSSAVTWNLNSPSRLKCGEGSVGWVSESQDEISPRHVLLYPMMLPFVVPLV